MKVLADENLSPALADSLSALFDPKHRVEHVLKRYGSGVTDSEWIMNLHSEGGWIVISGDRPIVRNRAEKALFRSSNLLGFFLSKGLCKAPVTKKMERLMALWLNIETIASTIAGGAMFELPMKSTRLKQI